MDVYLYWELVCNLDLKIIHMTIVNILRGDKKSILKMETSLVSIIIRPNSEKNSS
jgi:excinuclease UvrABC helicase subunit UvrB